MASAIDVTNIDENYPIAGIDNDSQGFRDNFTVIKTNLTTAEQEISTLQTNRARTDADNNHVGNKIIDAEFDATTKLTSQFADTTNTYTADFGVGMVHSVTLTNPAGTPTVSFQGWPSNGRYAEMRLFLTITKSVPVDTTCTLNATSYKVYGDLIPTGPTASDGAANFFSSNNFTHPCDGSTVVIDIFTFDFGSTLYFKYIGTFA